MGAAATATDEPHERALPEFNRHDRERRCYSLSGGPVNCWYSVECCWHGSNLILGYRWWWLFLCSGLKRHQTSGGKSLETCYNDRGRLESCGQKYFSSRLKVNELSNIAAHGSQKKIIWGWWMTPTLLAQIVNPSPMSGWNWSIMWKENHSLPGYYSAEQKYQSEILRVPWVLPNSLGEWCCIIQQEYRLFLHSSSYCLSLVLPGLNLSKSDEFMQLLNSGFLKGLWCAETLYTTFVHILDRKNQHRIKVHHRSQNL